jgi:hypothetical protein
MHHLMGPLLRAVCSATLLAGCSGTPSTGGGASPPENGSSAGRGGRAGGGGSDGGGEAGSGGSGGSGGDAPMSPAPDDTPVSPDHPATPAPDAGSPATDGPTSDTGVTGSSPLTAGWTQTPFTFALHTPYDLDPSERHSYDPATDTHSFWILRGDSPHNPPPNTTAPRSELRMRNDYRSGNHQFEADVFVVSGTRRACVMQVFGGVTNATSIMLFADPQNGGTIVRYDGPQVIKSMVYDRWWHLNVIHEASASGIGKIKVYADGQLVGTFDDRGNATHYFKCGVYGNAGDRAEARFRNIRYWVK